MNNILDDFFSWLKVHRTAREHLFREMREKYDWGYINACANIETELKRLIEEHKDASDGLAGNQGLLDEEVSSCVDHALPQA